MFFTSIETRFVRFEEEILKCRNTKRERRGERSETLTDNTSNLRRRQLNVIEGTSTENNYAVETRSNQSNLNQTLIH